MTRALSLCSGIGGLELAFPEWTPVAFAEIDVHATTVLAVRFPGVPHIADWTRLDTFDDYDADIITGGLPCQPVSAAGLQLGDADERWLFDDLLRILQGTERKPWLFLENVSAITGRANREAMTRFRTTLTGLGYRHTETMCRASDIGAPHPRRRWFMLAAHPDSPPVDFSPETPVTSIPADEHVVTMPTPLGRDSNGVGYKDSNLPRTVLGSRQPDELLKTPTAEIFGPESGVSHEDARSSGGYFRGGNLAGQLLPTPKAAVGGPDNPERRTGKNLAGKLLATPMADPQAGNSGTKRPDTTSLAQQMLGIPEGSLLSTPVGKEGDGATNELTLTGKLVGGPPSRPGEGIADDEGKVARHNWRQYQTAVDRWAELINREPPELVGMPVGEGLLRELHWMGLEYGPRVPAFWEIPTLLRLVNPQLPEWMMGFPYGWVTELLEPRPALRAIGSAVCPQQARLAANQLINPPQPALF